MGNSHTRSPAAAPALWCCGRNRFDLSHRPCIMGILNVTPDSFSDGNRFTTLEQAVARAEAMVAEGADIIDIGGESTRPGAVPVDADEEMRRVIPVIERLVDLVPVPLSIDTFKAQVAREAVAAGACIVNDISAMTFDAAMAATVAATDAGLVLMHTRGRPTEMQCDTRYQDLVGEVIGFLRQTLTTAIGAGIAMERVVIDPGIGFGKDVQGNLELMRRLGELNILGRPLLVGTSRKGFIGKVLGREVGERLFGTAATVALAVANGARILRVHDVAQMRDVARMALAICDPEFCF